MVAVAGVVRAAERLQRHPFEGQDKSGGLLGPVGFAEGRQGGEGPPGATEAAVNLGRVEEKATVVRRDRQAVMELGKRCLVLAPGQGHLPPKVPGVGRLGGRVERRDGKSIGVIEEPEFHRHPSAGEAQRHILRGEAERFVDLFHRLHPLPPLPEHGGIVAAGIDVGRASLHRLREERFGAGEILLIGGGETFVRKPPGFGELLLWHGAVAIDEPTARAHGDNPQRDSNADRDHGS